MYNLILIMSLWKDMQTSYLPNTDDSCEIVFKKHDLPIIVVASILSNFFLITRKKPETS